MTSVLKEIAKAVVVAAFATIGSAIGEAIVGPPAEPPEYEAKRRRQAKRARR